MCGHPSEETNPKENIYIYIFNLKEMIIKAGRQRQPGRE